MLKKFVQDFFSHAKRKMSFSLCFIFKHDECLKMAVGPSTALQFAEKGVFQQTAKQRNY